jgi:hypothetical protein
VTGLTQSICTRRSGIARASFVEALHGHTRGHVSGGAPRLQVRNGRQDEIRRDVGHVNVGVGIRAVVPPGGARAGDGAFPPSSGHSDSSPRQRTYGDGTRHLSSSSPFCRTAGDHVRVQDPEVVNDPRLADWAREATAERVRSGESPEQAELHGYADAIAALTLVRRIEAREPTTSDGEPGGADAQASGAARSAASARS